MIIQRMMIAACSTVFAPTVLQKVDTVGLLWSLRKHSSSIKVADFVTVLLHHHGLVESRAGNTV